MDNDAKPSLIERAQSDLDRIEAHIGVLEAGIATLQADLDKSIVSRRRLINALEVIKSYGEDINEAEHVVGTPDDYPKLDKSNPMYGKSVPEAAVIIIKEAGRPLTGKEIVKKMQDFGVVFTMPDPVMNANLSLNRRKDLVTRIERGRWTIKTTELNGSDTEIGTGCVKRVSDTDHYEKTLAGLAAARARGVFGGRKPVMVDGKDKRARELLQQGVPAMKVAKEIGISRSAIYRFMEENNIARKKYSQPKKNSEEV